MKRGVLYGVGVGPGDPELMTVKAVRIIENADVIIAPSEKLDSCYAYQIVKKIIPQVSAKEVIPLAFPMTKDETELKTAHNAIASLVKDLLEEGKDIAFLTIGDPCIYATYHYIHRLIEEAGFLTEIVNGVPSFCASAGRLGISLADKKEQIHIIPGSYEVEESLKLAGTKIYMKSGSRLKELLEILKEVQKTKSLQIYAVTNCGMEDEHISGSLEEIELKDGYLTTVIVKEV